MSFTYGLLSKDLISIVIIFGKLSFSQHLYIFSKKPLYDSFPFFVGKKRKKKNSPANVEGLRLPKFFISKSLIL